MAEQVPQHVRIHRARGFRDGAEDAINDRDGARWLPTGEITDWKGHSPEQLETMKNHLEELKRLGIEAIED